MRVLASDIGGTNARFGVFDLEARGREPLFERTYESRDFPDLVSAVRRFLRELDGAVPEVACLAVAGPVVDGEAEVPNLGWELRAADVRERVGISDTRLINDFIAIGFGIPWLRPEDIAVLQEGDTDPDGAIGVIGPGTGLGHGFLLWRDGAYHVHASEGGHVDFAPRDELEAQLFLHLKQRFGRVSYERIASGPGLLNTYRFLVDTGLAPESSEVRDEMQEGDPPRVISAHAMAESDPDPACVQALHIFVSVLGAQAGNLALTVKATGGVYLAGGIAPAILPRLRDGAFLETFRAKGRLSEIVEQAPVRVILDRDVGLVGAAAAAVPTTPPPGPPAAR